MSADASAFQVVSLADEEAVSIEGGALQWVPLRRRLGIQAFGTNAYRAARQGDPIIEEHEESPGQEELYVVVAGRVQFTVGEATIDAPAGTALFLPRPEVRRSGVALEDGAIVLAVGGWPGRPYHPLPWEPLYLTQEPMQRQDWARAAEILEREAGEHRDTAPLQFRMACLHARLGEHELALEELRRAVDLSPALRERAVTDEHLASLRELDGWPAAIA